MPVVTLTEVDERSHYDGREFVVKAPPEYDVQDVMADVGKMKKMPQVGQVDGKLKCVTVRCWETAHAGLFGLFYGYMPIDETGDGQ